MNLMTVADLKAVRAALDLTQAEMASALGVKHRTYQWWELGRSKLPDLLTVALIGARLRLGYSAGKAMGQMTYVDSPSKPKGGAGEKGRSRK